jgi:NADH-ubiquinone oxidoreductase chain 4
MLLPIIITTPLVGAFFVSILSSFDITKKDKILKNLALSFSILTLSFSLIMFLLYDNSSKNFQFIQEHYEISYYDFFFGVDGLSIYFIILTTLIIPISILSNWKSINEKISSFLIIILLLETSLLLVFSILDLLMFYMFFESILAPLFLLIGIYGSSQKVRASFYFFLYTLLGSLFMLLSIITMLSIVGSTYFDILSKTNFVFISQIFLFLGIFIAFAVKTPVIYLNS